MSDRRLEKKTLFYLLVLSVLLHLAVFELFKLMPQEKQKPGQEPTMVDLTDLPEPKPVPRQKARRELPPPGTPKADRVEKRQQVSKETAPKVDGGSERIASPKPAETRQTPPAAARPQLPAVSQKAAPSGGRQETAEKQPVAREGIFRPGSGKSAAPPKLFPSAGRLAHLEESYRKKYGREVTDGETRFLNTDDIQFGSFLRRFETAVYGVWHYPEAALVRGIEGTTPVRITFNRSGEIVQVELLESSGSGILDEEVMRTLKQLGPIGSFPRGYAGQAFKLIAFFQYGVGGGRLR